MVVPPTHDFTTMENITGMLDFMTKVDTAFLGGWGGIMILVVVFMLSLIYFNSSTESAGKAFIASSFIVFILSLLLKAAGLIPDLALWVALIMAAAAVAFAKQSD